MTRVTDRARMSTRLAALAGASWNASRYSPRTAPTTSLFHERGLY